MTSTQPKILLWDIETTHNLVAVFKLFGNDYIPFDGLVKERYVVCASWKTLGEKRISSVSVLDNPALFKKDPDSDYHVIKTLHDVLSEADVIIAHNGDAYDIKFTEARMIFHGLKPLPPILKIDTLKEAKRRFLFNSNRLDYLAQFLHVGKKKPTGSKLWMRVLMHDVKAIQEMVAYNKVDVEVLEGVFKKLAPYMATHVNRHLFGQTGCPRCGSKHIQSRGTRDTHKSLTQVYQRFQCLDCGGWFRGSKATYGTKIRILG